MEAVATEAEETVQYYDNGEQYTTERRKRRLKWRSWRHRRFQSREQARWKLLDSQVMRRAQTHLKNATDTKHRSCIRRRCGYGHCAVIAGDS